MEPPKSMAWENDFQVLPFSGNGKFYLRCQFSRMYLVGGFTLKHLIESLGIMIPQGWRPKMHYHLRPSLIFRAMEKRSDPGLEISTSEDSASSHSWRLKPFMAYMVHTTIHGILACIWVDHGWLRVQFAFMPQLQVWIWCTPAPFCCQKPRESANAVG